MLEFAESSVFTLALVGLLFGIVQVGMFYSFRHSG